MRSTSATTRRLLPFLTVCCLTTLEQAPAQTFSTAPNPTGGAQNLVVVGIDWKQAANNDPSACDNDPGGSDVGDVHWVSSILQSSNSIYFEGMGVPLRVVFTNIAATVGDVHVLDLRVQSTKAGIHAYDFLISWQQAVDAANFIAPGQNLMQELFVNRCSCEMSPPASTTLCDALHTSGFTAFANLRIPSPVGGPNCATTPDVIATRVSAFANMFPTGRTAQLFGDSPFSGTPTCTYQGNDQLCGDSYALYRLTWTSASTSIAIELAGHLAIGGGSGFPNAMGYDVGYGSSTPIGPLHFKLDTLDGFTLGNQDNQIVGSAIQRATSFSSLCNPGVGGVISCPCSNPPSGLGRGCNNSSGTGGAILSASGGAYLSLDSLVFTTSSERPTAVSTVLQWTGGNPTGAVFDMGVRCTSGTFKRLYVKSAVGGSITAPDFGAGDQPVSTRSAALGDIILAGQSRWLMVSYRDPTPLGGCPPSSALNCTQTGQVTWSP